MRVFDEIFHPVARELVGKCDAVLRIGGPSTGADDMIATGERFGKRIFRDLSEIPERQALEAMRKPLRHRRQRAGHHPDHGLGHQLLLPGRAGQADRGRDRLGDQHDLPGLQRGAGDDGRDLDVGRAADRPHRRGASSCRSAR